MIIRNALPISQADQYQLLIPLSQPKVVQPESQDMYDLMIWKNRTSRLPS